MISIAIVASVAYAVRGYFKLRFTRLALEDTEPEKRVELLDAIGRCMEKWRWR